MNAQTYTVTGSKNPKPTALNKNVFDLKVNNHSLVKQVYENYLTRARQNNAITKTRGLVRGGGRKPWRQKGTGNARVGSSRNPIWRGGGIVFGPTGQENYLKKVNRKAKILALKQALSLAAGADKIKIIEDVKLKAPKTSLLSKLLNKLSLSGLIIIIVDKTSSELIQASNNLSNVLIVKAANLTTRNVIDADHIIITKPALSSLLQRLEAKND